MKITALFLLLFLPAALAEPPSTERQPLFGGPSIKGWSTAESTLELSTNHIKSTPTALHWHITVDYYSGEPNYPIGWPRFSRNIPTGSERDWSSWDYLQMWIYTDSSRQTLPKDPVGLSIQAPDKSAAYHRSLIELKKGEWTEITIPTAQLRQPGDVRMIQFHISESNYKHQDQLDFFIDDLALVRYTRPTILEFAAESAVLFADTKGVPVRFQLLGIKPGESVPVSCELRCNGRVVAHASQPATRGPQRLLLNPDRKPLPAGTYEILARVGAETSTSSAPLRIVESPWK